MRGEDWSCKEPGVNVLVLTEALDAEGQAAKGFDIRESLHATNHLADYINAVPQGRTVRAFVQWKLSKGSLSTFYLYQLPSPSSKRPFIIILFKIMLVKRRGI